MSFILDALKKSENERQREIGPSLADVRIVRKNAERPWWVVAVAALLVVNLGVLLVVLMRMAMPSLRSRLKRHRRLSKISALRRNRPRLSRTTTLRPPLFSSISSRTISNRPCRPIHRCVRWRMKRAAMAKAIQRIRLIWPAQARCPKVRRWFVRSNLLQSRRCRQMQCFQQDKR